MIPEMSISGIPETAHFLVTSSRTYQNCTILEYENWWITPHFAELSSRIPELYNSGIGPIPYSELDRLIINLPNENKVTDILMFKLNVKISR